MQLEITALARLQCNRDACEAVFMVTRETRLRGPVTGPAGAL